MTTSTSGGATFRVIEVLLFHDCSPDKSAEIDTADNGYGSDAELETVLWLRDRRGSEDVTVTNLQGRPAKSVPD